MKKFSIFLLYIPILYAMEQNSPCLFPVAATAYNNHIPINTSNPLTIGYNNQYLSNTGYNNQYYTPQNTTTRNQNTFNQNGPGIYFIPTYKQANTPAVQPVYNQTSTKTVNNKKLITAILNNIQKEPATQQLFLSVNDDQALSILKAATKICPHTEFTKDLCKKLSNKNKYFETALKNRIEKIITSLESINANTINNVLDNYVITSLPQRLMKYCLSQAYSRITSLYEIPLPEMLTKPNDFIQFCDAKHHAALFNNNNKNLSIFDLTTAQVLLQKSFEKKIISFSFNKNGTQLAIADNSKTVSLYDSQTLQLLTSIIFKHKIRGIKFQTSQDILTGWYNCKDKPMAKCYTCIPEKNIHSIQYTKPEKINAMPYTDSSSNIYEIYEIYTNPLSNIYDNKIKYIKNITKKTNHNYALCYYAINNSKKNAPLHNIVASDYFNNLTEFEKNYIKQLISLKITR